MGWKGKIERIDEVTWEISKTHKKGMRVPTKIFASPNLLEGMKNDMTLEQGTNVAFLGGIYKNSVVLPDGHQGYGFPIGGVAATDAEEGVISPGGVGYDINCLPGDTDVLSSLGYRRNIEDVSPGDEVTVMNDSHAKPTEVILTQERTDECLYKISTGLGYEIKATGDHPILTRNGMKEVLDLSEGEEVALHPFNGVKYEDPKPHLILSESEFKGPIREELEKRGLLPLSADNEKLPYLLKIFGYLLGDGTVYDKNTVFYGKKEDLKEVKEDLGVLGYSAKVYERERKYDIDGKKFEGTEFHLKASARSLVKLLLKLGYPKGNKTGNEIEVPEWISNLPKWMKRLFLASFFGAEMSKPKTSNGYNFYMPEVKFSRKKVDGSGDPDFLYQISELLEDFDVDSTVSKTSEYDGKIIYRLLVQGVTDNLLSLWGKIGYEYNLQRKELAAAAVAFLRLKRSVKREREEIRKEINENEEELSIEELVSKYGDVVNRRFVERSLWGDTSEVRPPRNFVKFDEFKENFVSGEIVFDNVVDIEKIEHGGKVYDFTVGDENHNFVANGMVVSNCGVRLLRTDFEKEEVSPNIRDLTDTLFENVPSGVGSESKVGFSKSDLDDILENGAKSVVERGYGREEDPEVLEEEGCIEAADSSKVSSKAKDRGRSQVGSLGSGNHFLEVQYVDQVFDKKVAEKFGITHEGQVMAMIHTGSRGFGHQVCSDNLRKMEDAAGDYGIDLPDRELVNVPVKSKEGQDYLSQMACAANFAWANRQMITHWTRQSFKEVFDRDPETMGLDIIYDVAHNIAKFEKHKVNGSEKEVCVHRKGATRALPPGHPEVPKIYRDVGQPVIIPGNMGSASYVMVGAEDSMEKTFGSTAHGAGRTMSRRGAKGKFWGEDVKDELWEENHIYVKATHGSVIAEESPGAYKNIDEVAKVSDKAGIGTMVARLRPMGVAKG
ncbi:MAG: intein-containing RctB family protein [Candidatus Hadarchaeota archaeon]